MFKFQSNEDILGMYRALLALNLQHCDLRRQNHICYVINKLGVTSKSPINEFKTQGLSDAELLNIFHHQDNYVKDRFAHSRLNI